MGKGTDKLYITHSEWASENAYSASAGSGAAKSQGGKSNASFKRLPFNFCSLSLQPFSHPVCTSAGIIFDLTHILPWLKKHGTNPINGEPLKNADLVKLKFAKNDEGEYVDPVTFKVFTDNTHIVALKNTGNVFAWDTVEKLNVKGKMWRDLVSDEEFTRKDIVTLQDPQNIESRDLSSFKYLNEGESAQQDQDSGGNVNLSAMGSSAKILRAKEAVARAREERELKNASSASSALKNQDVASAKAGGAKRAAAHSGKQTPFNAARHTTGLAAASFTSTGLTPHTSADLALLTDEQYMLKRGRVKLQGYARIVTNHGDLNLELHTEHAPKAVWNFIQLAKKGYYKDVTFHRNIKGFMIQGGDPTGTGKGGESIWGKNFADETIGPLKHGARGTLSMANKGKDTNSSQFFIAYRALPHLNNKHTVFGRLIDDPSSSSTTLNSLESAPVDSSTTNRPSPPIRMLDVVIFVDPFEEFLSQKNTAEAEKAHASEANSSLGPGGKDGDDDEHMTWTGKRIREPGAAGKNPSSTSTGIGKYMNAAAPSTTASGDQDEIVGFIDDDEAESEHARKKIKSGGRGGFGNFDGW